VGRMATYTFNKEVFMEQMDKFVGDDEYIIFSTTPCGNISGASKRTKGKTMTIGFSEVVFDKPKTISDILSSKIAGMIVGKKEILSKSVQEDIKEYEEKIKSEREAS